MGTIPPCLPLTTLCDLPLLIVYFQVNTGVSYFLDYVEDIYDAPWWSSTSRFQSLTHRPYHNNTWYVFTTTTTSCLIPHSSCCLTNVTRTLVVCVIVLCDSFPFILAIKVVARTSWGHTGGRSHRIFHPPSFCGACLNFSREKDSAIPFPRRP